MPTAPLLLYSTNTLLAQQIGQTYYKDLHFVWCTSIFDGRKVLPNKPGVPPSSSPCEIYEQLHKDVKRGDKHSSKIRENKVGILRGAALKKLSGQITMAEEEEITERVNGADILQFEPTIYVIPFSRVKSIAKPVSYSASAGSFCIEYTIEKLRRSVFDEVQIFPLRTFL